MTEELRSFFVVRFTQLPRNCLVIYIRQHTIQKPSLWIVRITRLVRFGMMHMMGYYVDLFGKCFDDYILRQEPKYRVTELVRFMCAVAMKPDRAMSAHDDHAVNCHSDNQFP